MKLTARSILRRSRVADYEPVVSHEVWGRLPGNKLGIGDTVGKS